MPPNNPMTEGEALAVLRELRELTWTCGMDSTYLVDHRETAALDAAIAALTAHTAASGGEVVWIHVDDLAVLADPDERNDTPAFASLNDVDAEYRAGMVPFYRAPPSAVPADGGSDD